MKIPRHGSGATPARGHAAYTTTPRHHNESDYHSSARATAFGISDAALDPAALAGPADKALRTGKPVILAEFGVILVPDVFAIEGVANGLPALPDTCLMRRDDGRSLYVFRAPGATR